MIVEGPGGYYEACIHNRNCRISCQGSVAWTPEIHWKHLVPFAFLNNLIMSILEKKYYLIDLLNGGTCGQNEEKGRGNKRKLLESNVCESYEQSHGMFHFNRNAC